MSSFEVRTAEGEVRSILVNADLEFAQDGQLILLPGEMVTLALEPRGDGRDLALVVVDKWPADALPVLAADEIFSDKVEATGKPPEGTEEILAARGAPADAVRITFRQLPGKPDAVLIVESGYERAIDFRATMMLLDGQRRRTSVCEALPRIASYEHWPHPIVSIELDGFRFLEEERAEIACD